VSSLVPPCAALSISMERLEVCTYGKSIGEGPGLWGPSRFEIPQPTRLGRSKVLKASIVGPSLV